MVWYDFYKFWTNASIPVHFIRFEDILSDPKGVFTGVMQFLLNSKNIKGRAVEKYIDLVV